MHIDPFRVFVAWEGNVGVAEQTFNLEAQKVVKIKNLGTAAVYFDFDRSVSSLAHTLLSELLDDYIAHCALVGDVACHIAADTVNNDPTALTTSDMDDMCTSANSLKAKLNAHDNESGSYHGAAGTAHQVAASDATDFPSLVTLLNEIRTYFEAHRIDDAAHGLIDTTNIISAESVTQECGSLAQNETFENQDIAFTDLYLQAVSGTNAVKVWCLKW